MNPLESFRAAMRRAGLDCAGTIPADGQLHRFKADGDHNKNSWFVLHAGPPMAGAFGCWRRNFKETWCEKSPKDYSDAEWRGIQARWKQADIEREQVERIRREQAQLTAAWILKRGTAPSANHSYLVKKAVQPHGELCVYRGALALPLRDTTGQLHSLQFIGADGTKRFLSGGRIAGCFFTLADEPDGPLAICEGCATGASIHEATGFATVAAMNCGNLLPVAEALRAKWPLREIIIGADNDEWTAGNPGLTEARAAAKSIGAKLAVPTFKDTDKKPTDFNDLQTLEGLPTVKAQIEAATAPTETDEETFERLAKLKRADAKG
jgi:putative DNA primase/helicase